MDIRKVYQDILSERKKKVIIDSDAYNEIDDQYAVAYALKCKEKIEVLSINAAPFFNCRVESAEKGMERSYEELLKIISLTDKNKKTPVYKGSRGFLTDKKKPYCSDAAFNIINTANNMNDEILYVIAIGAITNIASALMIAPEIAKKMVVIWLGGNKFDWKNNEEFNLMQDVYAAQVVLESGAPFIQIPCMGVASSFLTTIPEIKACLQGKNQLCDYLVEETLDYSKLDGGENWFGWSKIIWDVLAIAVLTKTDAFEKEIVKKPKLTDDKKWIMQQDGDEMLLITYVYRDPIYIDCFSRLIKE